MNASVRRAAGMSLVEILVSLAIVSTAGVCVLQGLSLGEASSARAGENQLASMIATRVMDRFQSEGFQALLAVAGRDLPLHPSQLGEAPRAGPAAAGEATTDGVTFSGHYRVDLVDTGLLRAGLTLEWRRPARSSTFGPGSLEVIRYVADPSIGLTMRMPLAGARR